MNFTAVRDLLLSVEGVEALHSLHIWALTVAHPVLSVHIAIGEWLGLSGQGERGRQPEATPVDLAESLPWALTWNILHLCITSSLTQEVKAGGDVGQVPCLGKQVPCSNQVQKKADSWALEAGTFPALLGLGQIWTSRICLTQEMNLRAFVILGIKPQLLHH